MIVVPAAVVVAATAVICTGRFPSITVTIAKICFEKSSHMYNNKVPATTRNNYGTQDSVRDALLQDRKIMTATHNVVRSSEKACESQMIQP